MDQLSLVRLVDQVAPDEIYNLGAMSFVPTSWDQPLLTGEFTALGVTRMLEAVRQVNPKIRFYRTIKELEAHLGDPNVILNSFIISNTPFQQVRWWTEDLSKDEFTKAHVLFQKEDRTTYIKRLLKTAGSDQQVTVET